MNRQHSRFTQQFVSVIFNSIYCKLRIVLLGIAHNNENNNNHLHSLHEDMHIKHIES